MAAGSNNIVTDGLRGCWDAGNRRSYTGAGTTWTDPVGGIKGTLENEDDDALNFNSFKGGYFEFDGTDGRVDCGDAGVDNDLIVDWGELTVCVWALAIQSSQSSYGLVQIGGRPAFEMTICPPAHQRFFTTCIDGDWTNSDVGSMDPYWGKWAHYTVRWVTGTDNYRLYINGEVVKRHTFNDTHISPGANPPLYFAYRGTGKCLEGNIGSVYIYDRALSDAEIKQNYEATKSRFAPRITKSGLVGNWDAGDPESYSGGSTWKDTANGVVGICYNDTSVANAAFSNNNGGYIEFDGTDDYVVVSDVSHLDLRDKLTMSCWAWFDGDGGGSNTIVFGKEKSGSAQYSMVRMNSGDTLDVGLHTGGWTDFFTSTVLSDDTWYHLSATYDRSNVKVYVNGSLVDTTAETDAISGDSERFVIGGLDWQNNSTVPDHPMNGRVAIVRMYNKALSAAEIMDNYNKTKARFGH